MANVDLNAAIRSLVAAEVEQALEPYRDLLERMENFVRGAAPRGPVAVAKKKPGRKPGKRAAKAKGDASKFSVGQSVKYKQGRGEFEATVRSVDLEANTVEIERVKDGKKLSRPAGKIYAA